MPFRSEEIVQRFRASWEADRLGHAYLLTGSAREEVQELAETLAEVVLGCKPEEHPDYFIVQPESKSRRITVEQVRDLEKSLYLRPYQAKRKVAVIRDAERMCVPPAQAGNAFLKTLEEPPSTTLLLLTTTEPQLLLPTMLSRCIRLDLLKRGEATAIPETWLAKWAMLTGPHELRAYARAALLQEHWREERARIEEKFEDSEVDEETVKAWVEGEFQLARLRSLAALEKFYWQQTDFCHKKVDTSKIARSIQALEELKGSLETNVEPNLAIECTCLKLE